jgi:GTP-binding protein
VPIAFITAKDGRNIYPVLNLAQSLFKQTCARVGTGDLNRVVRQAVVDNPPPSRMNRRPKIFYATQVATQPPTIVLFTNEPELFDNTYQRYLIKVFRDQLPFHDVPINLQLRGKQRGDVGEPELETKPVKKKPRPARVKDTAKAKKGGEAALWDDV